MRDRHAIKRAIHNRIPPQDGRSVLGMTQKVSICNPCFGLNRAGVRTASSKPVSPTALRRKKENNDKIVMVTAYDYGDGLAAASSGADMVLVGDSAASVVHGDT